MFAKILLPYDGSEYADHAADHAAALAMKFGSAVLVLFAFHPIPRHWATALRDTAKQEELARGEMLARRAVDRLTAAGVRADCEVVEGLEHEVIVRTARARACDLIVIGWNGLGETSSFLLGSVSDRVVHRAHCPVLLVR